jgi:hypothetical protein
MGHQKFVVVIEGTDMYMIGYNVQNPPASLFGNLSDAVEYTTLEAAQTTAAAIGSGTVGTTKPNH